MAPPLLLTGALIAVRAWGLPAQSETSLATDVLVFALTNAIGVAMVWRRAQLQRSVSESWRREHEAVDRERVARLEAERALEELHTLRGIIPICSHCRQVRTDAGEWQQIEQYVHEHSAAQFSHGICPACARKRYADYLPGAT